MDQTQMLMKKIKQQKNIHTHIHKIPLKKKYDSHEGMDAY